MFTIPLGLPQGEFSTVAQELKELVSCCPNIPDCLKRTIQNRLDTPFVVATAEGALLDALLFRKYGNDYVWKLVFAGIYWAEDSLPSKIFLCPSRVKETADCVDVDSEVLYGLVLIHEVGHHIFKFDAVRENAFDYLDLSEGVANFFAYLVSDAVGRKALDDSSADAPREYQFYQRFKDWMTADADTCLAAFTCLADGDPSQFIAAFFSYLSTTCTDQIFAREMWQTLLRNLAKESSVSALFADLMNYKYGDSFFEMLSQWACSGRADFENAIRLLVQHNHLNFLNSLAGFSISRLDEYTHNEVLIKEMDRKNGALQPKLVVEQLDYSIIANPVHLAEFLKKYRGLRFNLSKGYSFDDLENALLMKFVFNKPFNRQAAKKIILDVPEYTSFLITWLCVRYSNVKDKANKDVRERLEKKLMDADCQLGSDDSCLDKLFFVEETIEKLEALQDM